MTTFWRPTAISKCERCRDLIFKRTTAQCLFQLYPKACFSSSTHKKVGITRPMANLKFPTLWGLLSQKKATFFLRKSEQVPQISPPLNTNECLQTCGRLETLFLISGVLLFWGSQKFLSVCGGENHIPLNLCLKEFNLSVWGKTEEGWVPCW